MLQQNLSTFDDAIEAGMAGTGVTLWIAYEVVVNGEPSGAAQVHSIR